MREMTATLGLSAGLLMALAAPAQADPQVLALVPTMDAVEMACHGATCEAELSAFCLQEEAESPRPGTAYRLVGGQGLEVQGQGAARHLSAADGISVEAVRGFTAVRVRVDRSALDVADGATVRVRVGPGVSLVPEALAADDTPEAREETALASGPLRHVGDTVIEGVGRDHAVAAQRLSVVINRLDEGVDPVAAVNGGLASLAPGAAGSEAAGLALRLCRHLARWPTGESLGACLRGRHDDLLIGLAESYWHAVKTGS